MQVESRGLIVVGLLILLAGCLGGGGNPGSGGNGGSDWCSSDTSTRFANPQTGEEVALEIQGIVEMDGRTVCKAVWETNEGEVRRMEMYWTEDESYRKMVTYDAAGEVIDEFEMENS